MKEELVLSALTDINDTERALVDLMAQLRALPDDEAPDALRWFVRSPWWHPMLMLCEGWQGQVARRAYALLRRDLDVESPGRRWESIDPAAGRSSIVRLLGLEDHAARYYAADAFKVWRDDDGRDWIAGAVGSRPWSDADRLAGWYHLDIRDVILWDPRTNDARIVGEHSSVSAFIMPDHATTKLRVWGDCGAYFRAWASARAAIGVLMHRRSSGEWKHPIAEAADGGLPGALLIGDYNRARWPCVGTTNIVAEAGVSVAELHFAVARATGMPNFERA